MNETLPHAIVMGVDTFCGLQTARILHRRGVPVVGVAYHPQEAFCRTNSCVRIVPASEVGPGRIEGLVALARELGDRPVLVPCVDEMVLAISRNRAALEADCRFALPTADAVELLVDKVRFYELAIDRGLPIPSTMIIRSLEDAKSAVTHLRWPAVVKPPHRDARWIAYTPAKAIVVGDPEEFMAHVRDALGHVDVLIAQDWIQGTDTDLYSYNACYDAQGVRLAGFTAKKIRQWPPRTGFSSLGEECRCPEVAEMGDQLFGSVDYRGLAYLEAKRDPSDGRYYIIEPNIGRPTGRSAIAEAGGVELVFTMYCDAVGLPLPENRVQTYQGVKWIYLRHDLQSAFFYWRAGELTLRQWIQSMRGRKAYAVWSLRDPLPFLIDIAQTLRRLASRKERKIFEDSLAGSTRG